MELGITTIIALMIIIGYSTYILLTNKFVVICDKVIQIITIVLGIIAAMIYIFNSKPINYMIPILLVLLTILLSFNQAAITPRGFNNLGRNRNIKFSKIDHIEFELTQKYLILYVDSTYGISKYLFSISKKDAILNYLQQKKVTVRAKKLNKYHK